MLQLYKKRIEDLKRRRNEILQGTKEQLIRIKEIERDDLEKNLNLIKQKINKINEEILKIELEEEESSEKDNSI